MKNRKMAATAALALICAVSVVSCGKDKTSDASVTINVGTTASGATTTAAVETSAPAVTTEAAVTTKAVTTAEVLTTEAVTVTEEMTLPEIPTETEAASSSPAMPEEFVFDTAYLRQPVSLVTAILGDSYSYGTASACIPVGDEGDKIHVYTYKGIKLTCYSQGGVHYICEAELTGKNVSTADGIKAGMTKDEVTAIYGTPTESYGSDLCYTVGSNDIYFTMDGDIVSSIDITANYDL
jgi:hypothetical protein